MKKIFQHIEGIQRLLNKNPEVISAILFGSVVKGEIRPRDIDIALYFEETTAFKDILRIKIEIEERLKAITELKPDIKILNITPLEAQLEIIDTGRVIYCRDWGKYTDYLERLSKEALETVQNRVSLKEAEEELYAPN